MIKITKHFATQFAHEWLKAWNTHDLTNIMKHYAEDVQFSSPFVLKIQVNNQGTLIGKPALRQYFEMALMRNPDLHFDLKHIMIGVKSITLIYTRNNSMLASEVMILNNYGLISEGLSHYPVESIYDLLQ